MTIQSPSHVHSCNMALTFESDDGIPNFHVLLFFNLLIQFREIRLNSSKLFRRYICRSIFIFLCFILIIIHHHTQEQRKIKIEQMIKLNHNIHNDHFAYYVKTLPVYAAFHSCKPLCSRRSLKDLSSIECNPNRRKLALNRLKSTQGPQKKKAVHSRIWLLFSRI